MVVTLWACNSTSLVRPSGEPSEVAKREFNASPNRKLDLLFMIDDSLSMEGSQNKLRARLPDFMKALTVLPEGVLDLHLAVISSSMGAGSFSNAGGSGCAHQPPGDDDGSFQHPAICTALKPGETFIKAGPGGNNFDGPIADLFGCVALLGASGCGFEQQFASAERALQRATNPADPVNGGFLRHDALLGVVMLTNEDDCSVSDDSTLLDPGQTTLADLLGGYQSYRCNEFGHLCDGMPPPHQLSGPIALHNCVSAEEKGRLKPVADFVSFLKQLKGDDLENHNRVLVAALTGKPDKYVVEMQPNDNLSPPQLQPAVQHSCTGSNPKEYGDPAVRIKTWVDAFGQNGVLESICDDDYEMSMRKIADAIVRSLEPACIPANIRTRTDTGAPDCTVTELTNGDGQRPVNVTFCGTTPASFPCWRLTDDPGCSGQKVLRVCREATCDPVKVPADPRELSVSCSLTPR
ncbi:MAG: hypothetical protein ABIS92_16690 [Polyangia bacterium]